MDIALAADRRRVAQRRCRRLAGQLDRRLLRRGNRLHRRDAAVPGAEHLGAQAVHAGNLLQPLVDIAAVQRMHRAVAADILEQPLARQIVDLLKDFLQPAVAQAAAHFLAALGAIAQPHPVLAIGDIAIVERGRALADQRAAADPDRGPVDQPHQRRHRHFLAQHIDAPVGPEQAVHLAPDPRQRRGKFRQLVEFLLVAIDPPLVMIAILLARRGVKAGRLDMAIGLHADPDIGIGRRHAQLPDPRQLDAVLQRAAIRQQILKPPPPPDARDARLLIAGIDQAGNAKRRAILYGADQDRGPEAAAGTAGF